MSWSSQQWDAIWTAVIRDILLTGTGMVLLLSQVFSRSPSSQLLEAGLALTVPSIIGHARVLLKPGGGSAGRSSSSTPPSGSSSSGSSSGAADDE